MFCRGKFNETSMLNLKSASVRFHSIKVSIGDSGSLDLSSILGGTIFFECFFCFSCRSDEFLFIRLSESGFPESTEYPEYTKCKEFAQQRRG